MTATHRPDPAGVFDSDTHRRVLGHLSTPDADYGWEVEPLLARLAADPYTPFPENPESLDISAEVEALTVVLDDLAGKGHAREYKGGIWRMTQAGFDALTGPSANGPGEPGPADLGPLKTAARSTPIGGK